MHIGSPMEDISIDEIAPDVLRGQKQETIQALVNKLAEEGIQKVSDLLKVSAHALEMKFASKPHFSLDETGYVNELRTWAERNAGINKDAGTTRKLARSRSSWKSRRREVTTKGGWKRGKGYGKSYGRGYGKSYGRRNDSRGHRREVEKKPAIWAAVENGDEELVAKLISEDADIEETWKGWSPLMKAAEENEAAIMRLLLQHKADIDVANRKGRTALSFAVAPSMKRKTACDTLKLLLEHKADPGQKDEMGLTAKARAVREKRQDALAILKEFMD